MIKIKNIKGNWIFTEGETGTYVASSKFELEDQNAIPIHKQEGIWRKKVCRDFVICGKKCIFARTFTTASEVLCSYSCTPEDPVPLIEIEEE